MVNLINSWIMGFLILILVFSFFSCKKNDCIPNGVCQDELVVFGNKCYIDSVCKGFGGTKFFNDCDLDKENLIIFNNSCK
jgi:hypothetical protein